MNIISRIFAASLLMICIYTQNAPENHGKYLRAPFNKVLGGVSDNIYADTLH